MSITKRKVNIDLTDPIINFDPSQDFYKLNPAYKGHFTAPSHVMWAIAVIAAPSSPYRELEETTKREIAEKDVVGQEVDWELYKEDLKRFENLFLTKAERFLRRWEITLEERQDFLDSIKYSLDTPQDLLELKEKWNRDTNRMWDQLEKCKKDLEKETSTMGSYTKSAAEEGKI